MMSVTTKALDFGASVKEVYYWPHENSAVDTERSQSLGFSWQIYVW